MTIQEYLEQVLGCEETSNDQLVGMCPFCEKDKHFYANKEHGAWDCKRCGETGSFWGLLKRLKDKKAQEHFFTKGTQSTEMSTFRKQITEKADYMYKVLTETDLAKSAREYLKGRGITSEDAERYKLGFADDLGAISIPYFDGEDVVGIKYRLINPLEGQPRYLNETNSKCELYNKNAITSAKEIIICEGELDAIIAHKLTKLPVVALPGKDSLKEEWLALLAPIKKIYLCLDKDAQDTAKKHALKLGAHKCYLVTMPYKDINEAYLNGLTEKEYAILLKEAKFLFEDTVVASKTYVASAVERMIDFKRKKGATTGWSNLDDHLGGLRPGDLTVITGDTASGKTSFCVSLLFNQIVEKVPCLFGSFEMEPATEILPKFCSIYSERNLFLQELNKEQAEDIIGSFVERFPGLYFIKGYGTTPLSEIEAAIRIAVEKYKVKLIVLDHLHYFVDYTSNAQTANILVEAMKKIKGWTIEFPDIHIILIVQTKQKKAGEEIDMDHIYGSSAIKQIGNNVIILNKRKHDTVKLNIAKARSETGKHGLDSNVYFIYNKNSCNFEEISEEKFEEENDQLYRFGQIGGY